MKHLFLLLFIIILLSACGTVRDENITPDNEAESADKPMVFDKEAIVPSNFENLVEIYNQAIIKTNHGDIKIEFYNEDSPGMVNNFLNLAKLGFYDQTRFHRVIKNFMIQGGDPNSRSDDWSTHGYGGPDYRLHDEFNDHKIVRGSVAMANSGIPNTNGSQFFIVTAQETPHLDNVHTNFGRVIEGIDVVEIIENLAVNQNNHPLKDATIESIELIAKQ
jgi:peptidyl-prolyl cis-trans isomerase B (cyclophilin B)